MRCKFPLALARVSDLRRDQPARTQIRASHREQPSASIARRQQKQHPSSSASIQQASAGIRL